MRPDEALFAEIIAGLEKAVACHDWLKDGGRFIPYPATWLNAKGWEDEYMPEVNPARPYKPRAIGEDLPLL
ncbi:hypothetical protein [Thermosinus carboxydivorans]|uniref:hypothetical protein n=1 Tax=Thermosinus carboxydivorans TaxID=261685 RepID=UPI0002E15DC6|nr:hypothetical protein [Thermosinus carboxydivorans]